MPDEIIESKTTPASNNPSTGSGNENQSVSINTSHLVSFCAAGLLVSFFLPWIQILFGKPSGFDFAKEGQQFYALWGLPFFSLVTLIAGMTKNPVRVIAQITGCLPFAILIWAVSEAGSDLLKALAVGAYAGLGFGFALIILPRNLK